MGQPTPLRSGGKPLPRRQILLSVAVFLGIVFVGDRLLASLAGTIVQHSKNEFARMYRSELPTDILFLGDSRVDRNISCQKVRELTGKRCLNLGLGGNSMMVSEALLKDYVQRYGNPELVVIEMGHSTVDPETLGEMRLFTLYSTNLQALVRKKAPAYATFQRVFASLRFNDPAFWRLASETIRPPTERLLHNKIPAAVIESAKKAAAVHRPIYQENFDALRRICEFADLHGIGLRLFISPCWEDTKRSIENFDEWKAKLQTTAGTHVIHDFSDAFVRHTDYFNDELHLNATGADRFVEYLRKEKVL